MVPYLDHYCHCGDVDDAVKHWFSRSQTREIAVKTSLLLICSFTIFICLTWHGPACSRRSLFNEMRCLLEVLTLLFLCFLVYEVLQGCKCVLVCVCLQSAYVLLHRKFAADWYPCSLRSPCPPQTRYWRQRHGARPAASHSARLANTRHKARKQLQNGTFEMCTQFLGSLLGLKSEKKLKVISSMLLLLHFCFVLISGGGLVWSGVVTRMWYVRWYLGADTEREGAGGEGWRPRQTRERGSALRDE